MPSILPKLKGMLHISDSHSKSANGRSATETRLEKPPIANGRVHSRRSSSSTSSEESKKSEHVLAVLKSTFNLSHLKTIKDVALQEIDGQPIDDKSYLMERIIQLAADLPVSTRTSATLTNAFLNQLWTDLQHPPQSYLGRYSWRSANGRDNNIRWPHLGEAKQPYARTVRPRHMQPVARPDPELIFDALLARKKFRPHPNKISSVLFYIASIIIHDIFHTNHDDFTISDTSSYLDLAPLYGSSIEDQHAVRTMRDGKLKPDCFSDARILGFPPGVGLLLVFFNRFHNQVADNLARIDEGGRFASILNPPGKAKPQDAEQLYDEALFQTARLVTSGLYINIILHDYVRTILNLNRVDSMWNLDPRSDEGSAFFGHKIPEATGNSVSAEFNLVYRWHSCVSERDEEWTKNTYMKLVGTNSPVSMDKFLRALNEWASKLNPDPFKRDFAGLKRSPNGKLSDEDLASIWTASVSDVAGSYGASHVPEILKNVEVLGIMQSRSWNLASLNEFRAYFKLEPHKRFEDINPDPLIAEQLRRLYGHPDNVEIYPGIVVEAAKEPKVPGSGLCTTFTTSRAILSDAVALVRGDRFYTVDYTPGNLTNWGFNEANYDMNVDYGCVFYKLVLNALPNSYPHDSVYAHYPLVVPEENKAILTKMKKASLYSFAKPMAIPMDPIQGNGHALGAVTDPTPSPLLGKDQNLLLATQLVDSEGLDEAAGAFYAATIKKLLMTSSYRLAGSQYVDVVRDVFNIAHAQFVTELFLLPKMDESELVDLLSTVYGSTNAQQPAKRYVLLHKEAHARRQYLDRVRDAVGRVINGHVDRRSQSKESLQRHTAQAILSVSQKESAPEDIATAQILPLAASVFINQARSFAEVLDEVLGSGDEKPLLSGFTNNTSNNSALKKIVSAHTSHGHLEGRLAESTVQVTLQALCDLMNLRRAAGPMGRIRRLNEGSGAVYLDVEESNVMMYPVSMVIRWEEE